MGLRMGRRGSMLGHTGSMCSRFFVVKGLLKVHIHLFPMRSFFYHAA